MKRTLTALSALVLLMPGGAAEAQDATNARLQEQVLAVAQDVRSQQLLIAENQAKIEEKLAAIADNLRMARIYAGRGGGGK